VEACPQYSKNNDFLGAAAMNQARLFNMHPTGKNLRNERLNVLMQKGGISDCGNAQNCVEACPKSIPLTESIADLGKQVSKQFWNNLFSS
jgi:succinate dehydrogenase / fumarate reductase iron-sulfur subunit